MPQHLNELVSRIAASSNFDAAASIVRTEAYTDSLSLFSRRSMGAEIRRIKRVGCGWVKSEPCYDRHKNVCGQRLWVHQPSRECILLLDKLQTEYGATFGGFDIAYDFVTEHTEELARWLEERIVMRWRRPGYMRRVLGTLYWTCYVNKPNWRQDFVIYSDLPSKLHGKQSPHFEIRQRTTQAVKKFGFTKPSDLLSLNPHEYFKRNAKLVDYDSASFIQKTVRKTLKQERDLFLSSQRRSNYRKFLDRYRASLAERAIQLCKRLNLDCAQGLQQSHPGYLNKLERIPIEVLKIDPTVQFKSYLNSQSNCKDAPHPV